MEIYGLGIHLSLGGRIHALLVRVMNLHVLLEIEEGELIRFTHLQELAKRSIRKDLPLILWILKVVPLAVGIDPPSDIRPGNELILRKTQEFRQFR